MMSDNGQYSIHKGHQRVAKLQADNQGTLHEATDPLVVFDRAFDEIKPDLPQGLIENRCVWAQQSVSDQVHVHPYHEFMIIDMDMVLLFI